MSGTDARPLLVIGNRNYSSWSLRPWIALRHGGIEFDDKLALLDFDGDGTSNNEHLAEFSPAKRVPVLFHGAIHVWESLAILEYAAETWPAAQLWPADKAARAHARTVANEMHAGFMALRSECPMNMRRPVRAIEVSEGVRGDVVRIEAMWRDCLECSGGPFLFGAFSNADAMYAPVVNRFHTYDLTSDKAARGYMERMVALPAWQEWEQAARTEPWVIEAEEV